MEPKKTTIEDLHPILGLWKTSGRVLAESGETELAMTGTDEYELMPGGRWIVHRVDVTIGEDPIRAIEMIGEERDGTGFDMRAFDSSGSYDEMKLFRLEDGTLLIEGEGVRSRLSVASDRGSMSALWEREADGGWIEWMEMSFEKIQPHDSGQPA